MSEPESASLIEREKEHMAKADEDLKNHEAAIDGASLSGSEATSEAAVDGAAEADTTAAKKK